jgi:hypothetical protein
MAVPLQQVQPLFGGEMRFAVCRSLFMPAHEILKTNLLVMDLSILSFENSQASLFRGRLRLAVGQDACLTARVEPRAGRLITVKLRNREFLLAFCARFQGGRGNLDGMPNSVC